MTDRGRLVDVNLVVELLEKKGVTSNEFDSEKLAWLCLLSRYPDEGSLRVCVVCKPNVMPPAEFKENSELHVPRRNNAPTLSICTEFTKYKVLAAHPKPATNGAAHPFTTAIVHTRFRSSLEECPKPPLGSQRSSNRIGRRVSKPTFLENRPLCSC